MASSLLRHSFAFSSWAPEIPTELIAFIYSALRF